MEVIEILKNIRKSIGFFIFVIGSLINYLGILIGYNFKTANNYFWDELSNTVPEIFKKEMYTEN